MTTPLESMTFFAKLLTAMVLLLNIGLLVAIRMAMKNAKMNANMDRSETGLRNWARARRVLMVLILAVVGMNAGTIYANQKLVKAAREVALQIPGNSDAEQLLSMNP
jgi:hypothetical protein